MTKQISASDADRLRMYMLMLVLMSFLQRITTSTVMFPPTPNTKMTAYRLMKIACNQGW